MYLAMARVAHREGYPEIGLYWEKAAWEEAEHAAKFAELLGEVVTDSTKKNLEMRVEAEAGACAGKKELATKAKQQNLDAIHDTVHEMAKDEARQMCIRDSHGLVRICIAIPCQSQISQSIAAAISSVGREYQSSILSQYRITYHFRYLRIHRIRLIHVSSPQLLHLFPFPDYIIKKSRPAWKSRFVILFIP